MVAARELTRALPATCKQPLTLRTSTRSSSLHRGRRLRYCRLVRTALIILLVCSLLASALARAAHVCAESDQFHSTCLVDHVGASHDDSSGTHADGTHCDACAHLANGLTHKLTLSVSHAAPRAEPSAHLPRAASDPPLTRLDKPPRSSDI